MTAFTMQTADLVIRFNIISHLKGKKFSSLNAISRERGDEEVAVMFQRRAIITPTNFK